MKFKKFGKALLMSALSAGVILSVTSCVQSYTAGFLYVTGTLTSQSTGNGIISGFKIDHNTGQVSSIHGMPVASGGANPVRAVLLQSGRFLYVLNRGVTARGGSDCTTLDPCQNSNIVQFAVGGNGILTPQPEVFYTQGINPFRMIADSSGNYIYVLDHDSPDNTKCSLALGSGYSTCGDITAFSVNQTTGRLQLVVNAQVTTASGAALPYFPVPPNPVDFVLSGNLFTMSGPAPTDYPYSGGSTVFPYTYSSGSGQLTINQYNAQPLNITKGTALVSAGSYIYALDNEPLRVNGSVASQSQVLQFSPGTNGSLSAQNGAIPDDATQENPISLLIESNKWIYLANQGNNNTSSGNAESGITGFIIDQTTHQLSQMPGLPFGTGSGPQCIVDDPTHQFIYTANFNDSTITGQSIDAVSGELRPLTKGSSFPLTGPATFCLISGRTS